MAPDTAEATQVPRTHLLGAVLVTCLCFLPLGLVAVVFAWRTSRLNEAGEFDRARRSSRAAMGWLIATIVVGVLLDVTLGAALALLGAFGS